MSPHRPLVGACGPPRPEVSDAGALRLSPDAPPLDPLPGRLAGEHRPRKLEPLGAPLGPGGRLPAAAALQAGGDLEPLSMGMLLPARNAET